MVQTNAINSQMGFKRNPNFVTVPVNTSRQPSLVSDTHITFVGTFTNNPGAGSARAVLSFNMGINPSSLITIWQYHFEITFSLSSLENNFDKTFEAIIPAEYYYEFNNSGTTLGSWTFSQVCEIPM